MKQPKQQTYPYPQSWPPAGQLPPGYQLVPVELQPKKAKAKQKPVPAPKQGGLAEFILGLVVGAILCFLGMTIFSSKPTETMRLAPAGMPTARPLTLEEYQR
jgi:hypothetical protein